MTVDMAIDNNKRSYIIQRVVVYTVLIVLAILCAIPFYLMFINSTRASADINHGLSFIPGTYLLKNFKKLVELGSGQVNVFRGLLNSAFIASTSTVLGLYVASLAAYGFAFYNFKGKNALFAIILAVLMVPVQLGLIGYFQLAQVYKLLDTYWALILPAGANVFSVFFLRQYAGSVIDYEMIQAARIEGAGEVRIFHTIGLPLLKSGIATMAIFAFVGNWNNYLGPLVLLFSTEKFPIPVIIGQLNTSTYKTDFGVLYLAIALSLTPILIIFVIFQRFIIEGISLGALKE
ncbi:carbohydrate ABC transporter permease [Spirochaetia bacterium 38H-sp]|uniref:Carbohydrate ABC transporter permease n=1 Tax=Rarispira pelagica TaxID=3141764 RepID=A0ABU9UAW9_9SPIR